MKKNIMTIENIFRPGSIALPTTKSGTNMALLMDLTLYTRTLLAYLSITRGRSRRQVAFQEALLGINT